MITFRFKLVGDDGITTVFEEGLELDYSMDGLEIEVEWEGLELDYNREGLEIEVDGEGLDSEIDGDGFELEVDVEGLVSEVDGEGLEIEHVGQIKYITTDDSRYGSWENITTTNKDKYMTSINILNQQDIKLKHGGRLQFFKHFISKLRCEIVLKDVLKSNLLRQYTTGSLTYEEPRVHVLLASDEHSDGGYQ